MRALEDQPGYAVKRERARLYINMARHRFYTRTYLKIA